MEMYIDLAVKYLPLLLVLLGVIIGGIKGLLRGAHKSTILFIHAAITFCICLIIFIACVNLEVVDKFLLTITNRILSTSEEPDEPVIQLLLDVSAENTTFRACLLEFIPKNMNFMDGLELILKENGAYLNTLVDLVYRIVFGIICWVLHIVLTIISHLIYWICWPEKRYRRKTMRLHQNNELEYPYRKRRWLGAVIGASRSLVKGMVFISFLGTIFFIVSGGKGDEEMPELDFGDDGINLIYSAYSSISEYGTEGIYKVLNAIDDDDEVPYYLFAADIIFKGGIEDIEHGITTNVYFREEIAAYVGFARNTLQLLLKYGGEDIKAIISGGFESEATMEYFMEIICNYEFQEEFTNLITTFDTKTYFINLSLSLVDSFVRYMDETNLVGDLGDAQEIMSIAFKPGYLSERIPYEKELKESIEEDKDSQEIILDYINASSIITENDIVEVLNVFYSYLNIYQNLEPQEMGIELIKAIVPRIKNLSIFDSNNRALNGVLRRIYAFVDYVYLTEPYIENIDVQASYSVQKERYYISQQYESINWIDELVKIIDIVDDVWYIYEECFTNIDDILKSIFSVFDDEKTMLHLDEVIKTVYESRILGEVLSSQFIYITIEQALMTAIPGVHIINDISYSDVYDEKGNLVKKGELYYVLTSIKALGSTEEARSSIEGLINLSPDASITDIVNNLINLLYCETESGEPLCNHLINSQLVQSILSGFLFNIELEDGVKLLYAADEVLQKDKNGNPINVIIRDEFVNFFNVMEMFFDIASPFIDGSVDQEDMINEVFNLLKDNRIEQIISSKLIEGTLSNLLVSFLSENDIVVIPSDMKNGVGMVSTPYKDSEIKTLCNVFRDTTIDIALLFESGDIMGELSKINSTEIELLLSSGILHHTVSNFIYKDRRNLISNFILVIPNSVMVNDVIEKNTIVSFLDIILKLLPDGEEEFDGNSLITKIRENKDVYLGNDIISATLSYALVNNQDIISALGDMIIIPTSLKTPTLDIDKFESGFGNTGWNEELNDLLASFDILIGNNDISTLADNIVSTVLSLNEYYDENNRITKLQKIYESNIMSASISNQLDIQIRDNNIVSSDIEKTNKVLDSAHDNNGCFKISEIESLLDSFTIFGIVAENNNIDINPDELIENITRDLMNYNSPCEVINRYNQLPLDMRPSTLDIIYGSAIVRSLVSEQLNSILTDINGLGLTEQYNKILVDEYDNYKKSEVKALIKLLEILDISGDSLTTDNGNDSINAKLSEGIDKIRENLDILYDGSNIVGVIIHKELYDNGFRVPTSCCKVVEGDYINSVSLDEAKNLFTAMDEIGIEFDADYSIGDFDINSIDLSTIYTSGIIKYYISDLLETKLLDLGVLPTIGYDAMKTKFKTIDKKDLNCTDGYFNENELRELISFLEDVLGISLDNTTLEDPNVYIHKIAGDGAEAVENRRALENSYLTRAIISHQILNFIESSSNNFLVDTVVAHEKNGDVVIRILRYSEIDALLGMISGDLTDYNPNTISLSQIKSLVASESEDVYDVKSFILNASISEELLNSNDIIQVPASIYDDSKNMIHPYHLGLLIDALIALVGDNGVHFESFNEFKVPQDGMQFEVIAKSIIMRASISFNLKISDTNALMGVVNDLQYGEVVKNVYDNNILVLSETETINIFKAINRLFNEDEDKTFNISMEKVMSSADATVFSSNLLCVAASTYLNNKGLLTLINLVTGRNAVLEDVIITNGTIYNDIPVYSSDDIIYILETCQDIINGSYLPI